jgi:hypothetical protein
MHHVDQVILHDSNPRFQHLMIDASLEVCDFVLTLSEELENWLANFVLNTGGQCGSEATGHKNCTVHLPREYYRH